MINIPPIYKLGIAACGLVTAGYQYRKDAVTLCGLHSKCENAFQNFKHATKTEKELLEKDLHQAYVEIRRLCKENNGILPKKIQHQSARIFYIYGHCLYGGKMEASRQMFQLSFAIQLISLQILKRTDLPKLDSENLEGLPKQLSAQENAFEQMDKHLMQAPQESFVDHLCGQEEDKAFFTAMTLRWLGATYQNLDKYKKAEFSPLFEKVYGIPEDILKNLNSKSARWEIGQLIYNTRQFRYLLANPGKTSEAWALTKEQLFPYLDAERGSVRAEELRAQIHNKNMLTAAKITPRNDAHKQQLLEEQYNEISQAASIAARTEGFHPFLKTLFTNNRASRAIACHKAGLQVAQFVEIEQWIKTVLDFCTANNDHYYNSTFLLNAVRFEMVRNDKAAALKYLDRADEINQRYLDSSEDTVAEAAKLRKELQSMP